MPRAQKGPGIHDALCLCEYYNKDGERSHLLACCCDCQALDTVCDRWLTCNKVDEDLYDNMCQTFADRLRIPTFMGKGAIRVHPDVAIPAVLVPMAILLATINQFFTVVMLIALPGSIILYYNIWLRQKTRKRTQVFYVWGFVSATLMYVIFAGVFCGFRKILLWEFLLESTLFGLLMYSLYLVRRSPGVIKRSNEYFHGSQEAEVSIHHREPLGGGSHDDQSESHIGPMGKLLKENFGFTDETFQEHIAEEREKMEAESLLIPEAEVSWVDSRPIIGGMLRKWCDVCRLNRPARSGHCPVCNVCIYERDHHCVWIDTCVGARNHLSFFWALVLLVVSGYYGVHLTLTTVCTPEMYANWFLFVSDCRFVYADLPTALSFVSAWYTLIFTTFMFLTLVSQCIFISINLTSQEHHHAGIRGWTRCLCVVKNNVNNRGCLRNWGDFLTGRRQRRHRYGALMV